MWGRKGRWEGSWLQTLEAGRIKGVTDRRMHDQWCARLYFSVHFFEHYNKTAYQSCCFWRRRLLQSHKPCVWISEQKHKQVRCCCAEAGSLGFPLSGTLLQSPVSAAHLPGQYLPPLPLLSGAVVRLRSGQPPVLMNLQTCGPNFTKRNWRRGVITRMFRTTFCSSCSLLSPLCFAIFTASFSLLEICRIGWRQF